MFKKGDTPVAGYTLVNFLGRGQYGEVWGATAPGGTEVALKFIALQSNSGAVELKALRAVKLIRHPNLIAINAIWVLDTSGNVLDDATLDRLSSGSSHQTIKPNQTLLPDQVSSDTESAFLVIAMAKADKSLEDRLKEAVRDDGQKGIPVEELCDYIDQAAAGLDFLNEERHFIDGKVRGVIHRDVKPANLLLVGNAVVVGDFGVATTLKDFDATATSLSGSIGFMSPESIARKPSPTTDQYALAISYYWMRTNSLPYAETISIDKLLEIHRTGSLNFDFVGSDEQKILQKATSTDPKNRFKNCRELAKAIKDFHAEKSEKGITRAKPTSVWKYALSSVLLIAFVLAVFFWPRGNGGKQGESEVVKNEKTSDSLPVPIPERTLTLDPDDTTFEVVYVDKNGKSIVLTATEKIMFPLPDDGTIEVRSMDESGLFQPFAKTKLSVADLEEKSWSIKLVKKSLEEIRAVAMQMVVNKKRKDALQLLILASREYPKILELKTELQSIEINGKAENLIAIPNSSMIALSNLDDQKGTPVLVDLGQNASATRVAGGDSTSYIEDLIVDDDSSQLYVLRTYSVETKNVSDEGSDLEVVWSSKASNIRLTCATAIRSRPILAVGDRDGVVHLIPTDVNNSKKEVKIGEEAIVQLIAGEAKLWALGQDDSLTQIGLLQDNETEKKQIALPFDPSEEEITEVNRSGDDGMIIATDSHIYHCESLNADTPKFTTLTDLKSSEEVLRMQASQDGRWLLFSTDNPNASFELWDVQQKVRAISGSKSEKPRTVTDMNFSPNGMWAVVAYSNGTLTSISMTDKSITEFNTSQKGFRSMAEFDSQSKYLVSLFDNDADPSSGRPATTAIEVLDFEKCQTLFEASDRLKNR